MTPKIEVAEIAPLLSHWGIEPLELKAVPGGLSGARIWRVSHEGHEYCLRCWPVNHPSPDQLRTIHQLIEHVRHLGITSVPKPYRTLTGNTFLSNGGHLWELTAWLAGQPLGSHSSNEQQRIAACETLARFHLAAASFGPANLGVKREPAPGLLRRRDLLAELLQGRLAELFQAVHDEPRSPTRETLLELLSRIERILPGATATVEHCASIPLPLQWCLRDVHPGNVLVIGTQVTGIVDFGAVAIDSVAGDIARLVGGLQCERADRQKCFSAYARLRPLTNDELRSIAAFHVGGLILSATNWIRWICIEHTVSLANTTQARLEELLRQITLIGDWNMQ
ncbi:phosphotransferase enzyme family protein [Bythopirellula goksoeyrii]|uniref:phosphotransferase enzyme family protein n=1 Tax=Bythopirellula goksoeyrii TaxID=1400387 RepID=UPI00143DF894|nr:phosphotransferase [Bythopirellula goksoeyrii]